VRAQHLDAAGDRAQVVRIGDAVEEDDQRRLPGALRRRQQIADPRLAIATIP
jgi:hypothetical protein